MQCGPRAWSRRTARSGRSTASTSRCPRARCSACSAPTGRARRRSSGSSPPCSARTPGVATVAGIDVLAEPAAARRQIGLSGQYAAVDEYLTGFENLDMVGRLYRLGKRRSRERARELLAQFELEEAADRPVKTYSGGMRRRLDLAGALVAEPPVLFLDEPTTGLDPRSRTDMWDVITELVAGGTTLLLTTQYLEEADRLADDIVVIDHGRVIAEGTADALKAQVGGERIEIDRDRSGRPRSRRASCSPRWPSATVGVEEQRRGLLVAGHRRRQPARRGAAPPRRRRHIGARRRRAAPPDARRRLPVPDRPRGRAGRRTASHRGDPRMSALAPRRRRPHRRQAQPDQDQAGARPAGLHDPVADHVRAAVRLRLRWRDRPAGRRQQLPRVPDRRHLRPDGHLRRHHHRRRAGRGHPEGHHRPVPLAADVAVRGAHRSHGCPTSSTT